MATVLIRFDGENRPVVMGAVPASPDQPIANPEETGYTTNTPFIVAPGIYCFGLRPNDNCSPLWRVCQAVDGTQTELNFMVLR